MNSINSVFLFMIFINIATSHHYRDLNSVHDSVTSVRNYFANLLKSLVDLNEQRIKTLNQLYMLNKIDFGKILRTDKDIDYDEIIMSIASIMSLLSNKDDIVYPKDNNKDEAEHDNIRVGRAGYEDSDDNDNTFNENKQFNYNNDFNDNDKNRTVYKKGYISCGRPLLRCIWSCYDAVDRACRVDDCTVAFEIQMEISCKTACLSRFYY